MKHFSLCFIAALCFCLSMQFSFGQTSAQITQHLSGLLFKLQNADSLQLSVDTVLDIESNLDSVLIDYAKKSPELLYEATYKLDAIHSDDHQLIILGWNSPGGTQHFFENVFLYKTDNGIKLTFKGNAGEPVNVSYDKIYTLKAGSKTYYLITYSSTLDFNENVDGIQVFSLDNGRLNDNVRIIKTTRGLNYKLPYRYFHSMDVDGEFLFNAKLKTLTFPIVDQKLHKTYNVITYKFNGQYFEKIK